MNEANLVYRSNVWPENHAEVLKDTAFLRVLVDATILTHLKNKCESDGCNPRLFFSEQQLDIVDKGPICSHAQGDPCWGMVVRDGIQTWECRCIRDECKYFSKCRPDCTPQEVASEKYHLAPHVSRLAAYKKGKDIDSGEFIPRNEKPDPEAYERERKKHFPAMDLGPNSLPRDELDRYLLKTPPLGKQKDDRAFPNLSEDKRPGRVLHPQVPTAQTHTGPVIEILSTVSHSADTHPPSPALLPSQDINSPRPSAPSSGGASEICHTYSQPTSTDASGEDLQRAIIEASIDRPVFVEAGPGTGKTHVLIQRVNHMVTRGGIPPEQIIVLSFTNAAVNEVRQRLQNHVDSGLGSRGLRNVDVRTFHSLAWFLLDEANRDENLKEWVQFQLNMEALDYEACVRKAGELLEQFPSFIENWHVIVDEVQDLTNERAFFVLTLIKSCLAHGGSVVALGDFCQSIFDYSAKTTSVPISSGQFRAKLLEHLDVPWLQCHLLYNHRQTPDLDALVQPYRKALLGNNLSDIQRELAALREAIPTKGKLLKDWDWEPLLNQGKTCLLCRKNADVIQLSTSLHTLGIPHIANTYADSEGLARWIAEIFTPEIPEGLSFEEFAVRASSSSLGSKLVDQAWESLRLMLGATGYTLSVQDILASLQRCLRDDSLFRPGPEHTLTVSTVHKAKGREYDRVVIDSSLLNPKQAENGFEEFRILYVALTRPRREIFTAELVTRDVVKSRQVWPSGRKRMLGYSAKKLTKIEIRNEFDIDKGDFFFSDNYRTACIRTGTPIRLIKKKDIDGDVRYLIMYESDDDWLPAGNMQRPFLEDIESLVKPESFADWPDSIDCLYVNAVFSHIGVPTQMKSAPLEAKLWLDFQGIGRLTYGTY